MGAQRRFEHRGEVRALAGVRRKHVAVVEAAGNQRRTEHPRSRANADRLVSRLLSVLHRRVLGRHLFAAIRVGQVRQRGDSNTRCAFQGAATSSLVDGTTWAFAAGDTRPSTIAAAGTGAILRLRRRSEVAGRDVPRRSSSASNRENENAHSITCPLWEATVAGSVNRRHSQPCRCTTGCPKKHREPLTKASPSSSSSSSSPSPEHGIVGSEGLLLACNVSDEKKVFRTAKEFAPQSDDTMATSDSSTSCRFRRASVMRSRAMSQRR